MRMTKQSPSGIEETLKDNNSMSRESDTAPLNPRAEFRDGALTYYVPLSETGCTELRIDGLTYIFPPYRY